MSQSKGLHSIKNKLTKQIQQEPQKVAVKNTINWGAIVRVVCVFIVSFVVCYFSVQYLLTSVVKLPKIKLNYRVGPNTPNLQIPFSQTLKKLSSLLPQKKYDYFQLKRPFIDAEIVREALDKKDKMILLVDIRSAEEYKNAHIKTAMSAPAYTNSRNVYGSIAPKGDIRQEISKSYKGKQLVVIYGYKPESDIVRDVYENLSQLFPVRILGISFYEWKNNFYSWVPGAEFGGINMDTYIEPVVNILPNQSGSEMSMPAVGNE